MNAVKTNPGEWDFGCGGWVSSSLTFAAEYAKILMSA